MKASFLARLRKLELQQQIISPGVVIIQVNNGVLINGGLYPDAGSIPDETTGVYFCYED